MKRLSILTLLFLLQQGLFAQQRSNDPTGEIHQELVQTPSTLKSNSAGVPNNHLTALQTVNDCDTTFLKTYGTTGDNEDSRAIAVVPLDLGGGFLLGGGKADSAMITWVDEVGDIIWTRSFNATFDAEDYVTDLIFDSEHFVVGVGQTKNEPQNNRECFIFRYDMVSNTMLWINELDLNDPANETYVSIIEISPGGNFIVSGQTDDFIGTNGCDGILVEVDRLNGTNQWQQNLTLGSCETFSQIIGADGSIYATGRLHLTSPRLTEDLCHIHLQTFEKHALNTPLMRHSHRMPGLTPQVAGKYGIKSPH